MTLFRGAFRGSLWVAVAQTGAVAQVTPNYGIDFVTIGAPGNPGYAGPTPPGMPNILGRGSVNYTYRIGRLETTTAQWMEFVNTYSVLGGSWTFFAEPIRWGAVPDPAYSGPGRKYTLNPGRPGAAMIPVYGISWRTSAMYCNWLCNGKSPATSAIENGAYDTSTFTNNPDGTFNDQLTHNAGAQFWIPTFDEWTKAAHYDPNRYGPDKGGYWLYSDRSDEVPTGGPPGQGEANTGFTLPNFGHYYIPLGSYPDTQSPWGLLDTEGMSNEHTEYYWFKGQPEERGGRGSWAGGLPDPWGLIWAIDARRPGSGYTEIGLRIASSVPEPGLIVALLLGFFYSGVRRQREV